MFKKIIFLLLPFIFISCGAPFATFSAFPHTDPVKVSVPGGCSGFVDYFPDGKISVVKKGSSWQMFWGEREDFLTSYSTPWMEDHISQIVNSNIVYGGGKKDPVKGFSDNGAWFIGVFPLDNSGNYVGFYHAESWWTGDSEQRAYKSIGVTYSSDSGKTWSDSAPIIVDNQTKPSSPSWSGLGDGCVIRDEKNNRWICYYQAKTGINNTLCMAASTDPRGSSGTWKKWDGSDFTIDAYNSQTKTGGTNVSISNLSNVAGANPSVMWNEYLQKYIMVYHSWTHQIFISFSTDLINWTSPEYIMDGYYPNLISTEGDLSSNRNFRMYYAPTLKTGGKRDIYYVEFRP